MRMNRRKLFENKERAIKQAKEKILERKLKADLEEKECEKCLNWKRENEEIGFCKQDKIKSFFFFSCSKFFQRKVNNIEERQ